MSNLRISFGRLAGFRDELSLACAEVFAEQIIERLKKCGVKLGRATRQSDNGSEFIGSRRAKDASAFTKTIESVPGQGHKTIPPGAHRFPRLAGLRS